MATLRRSNVNINKAQQIATLNSMGQDQLRRFEVACSSALVNLVAEDLFFDMPDSATIPEPRRSLASHNDSPLKVEAGRPLQDL